MLDVGYRRLGPDVQAIAVHRAALFNVLHRCGGGRAAADPDRLCGRRRWPSGAESGSRARRGARGRSTWWSMPRVGSPLKIEARVPAGPRPLEFGAIWGTVPWVDAGFRRDALMQRYRKASVMIGVLPIGRQNREDRTSPRSSGASSPRPSRRCGRPGSTPGARRCWPIGRRPRRTSRRFPISSR